MKMVKIAAGVAMTLASGALFAQGNCASPIAIQSDNNNNAWGTSGTTCGRDNDFPTFPGFIPSEGPDVVHSFVADNPNAVITLQADATFTPAMVLLDACTGTAGIVDVAVVDPATPGQALSMNVAGLTNGNTYYLVVSHHPDALAANRCGGWTGTITGQLPVELQSFSVE